MTCSHPSLSACESPATLSAFEATASPALPRTTPLVASNPLERLAELMNSNDRLMDELVTSRARIVAARTYLDRPGCHIRFGEAHLDRCRSKHSGILATLRANRIEALHLLGVGGSGS